MPTIRKLIDEFTCDIPECSHQIDWGPKKRGQGKRSGGTIKGSMSAAPNGIKTYYGIDNSKYKNDFIDDQYRLVRELWQLARYYKSREFGCNHIESLYYAIT